jgi:arsenite methyltransferase
LTKPTAFNCFTALGSRLKAVLNWNVRLARDDLHVVRFWYDSMPDSITSIASKNTMPDLIYTHDLSGPIAFFGGVYGNLPGLRACLADASSQGSTLNVFLGDATGCCGHSDAALDLLRDQCKVFIAGNHEVQAAAGEMSCGCGYGDGVDEQLSCDAHAYAMYSLREDQREWIGTWPETGVVSTVDARLLLCHGSPDKNNEFLYESELNDARLEAWLERNDCDVMGCTHTGLPWVRYLPGGRVAFNAGVVGKPDHDGDAAVHYALLSFRRGHARVEIRRVEYDHNAWAAQLEKEGVASVYLSPMRTGWWTVGESSLPAVERARRPVNTDATAIAASVSNFYRQVAIGDVKLGAQTACCEPSAAALDSTRLGYDKQQLVSLPAGADMGLGCGTPVDAANLQAGETVLDLGSGGGIDCILAARAVGEMGRVIGVDATPEMIAKAQSGLALAGFTNVDLRVGAIEKLPVASSSVDVVISNCVINLSQDKPAVFREAQRVLKSGGRFVVSDTVAIAAMPDAVKNDPQMQACCVSGAMTAADYEHHLKVAGFTQIEVAFDTNSRDIVGKWVPESGAENWVSAATIRAVRP